MRPIEAVSRRNFMRTAAAAAAAPTMAASVSAGAAGRGDILVAATVVRASISKTQAASLRIGVRVSVLANGYEKENLVVSVDGVRFDASADETRRAITAAVQARVIEELASNGETIASDRVAVQVFGGVL